jgi:hypothetical protein
MLKLEINNYFGLIPEEYLIPSFLIGTILEILISGFIFKMSLKTVGGQVTLPRALMFSLVMRSISLIISIFVPSVFFGLYTVMLSGLIWLLLVMGVFKIGFIKAVLVAVIQSIITFTFIFLGIPLFIQSLKG